ncbi:VOC family protein [Minwuia sp.]|uniref:VOC family protein n=1 Tax=Minwuia sp. TaxID=2493630 RepID=UPI003A950C44
MGISIANIDHVVLNVQDMDRALSFYRDVLGCNVEREVESIGLVQMRAGACMIDLVPADRKVSGPNMDHFCVRVEPWDEAAVRAHLEKHSVAVDQAGLRYGAEGEGPSIYITDPDGNTVELKGPAV